MLDFRDRSGQAKGEDREMRKGERKRRRTRKLDIRKNRLFKT